LGLGSLGPLQAALDLVGPFRQRLVEPRQQDLPEREEDDAERDCADDELCQVGDQWVLQLFGRYIQHGGYLSVWRYLVLRKNGTAMPISASASVSAKPIHMKVVIRLVASGCRAMASMACPKTRPMPMPGPIAARP